MAPSSVSGQSFLTQMGEGISAADTDTPQVDGEAEEFTSRRHSLGGRLCSTSQSVAPSEGD